MKDNLEPLKELLTKDNYSFYISIYGDMEGSSSSSGIYQLDENTAFVSISRRENHHAEEEKIQYKVSIDLYDEIFDLIKKHQLIKLADAPKEKYIAYDMATSDYCIRIGDKNYCFTSRQQLDQKKREVIWQILDLIHSSER